MRKLKTMNKKGVFGMDSAKAFILAMLTIGVISFAVLIAMSQLNASSASTAATTNVFNNISSGVESLFSNAGTWFSLLAVVILILIISVVIFAVNRFGGSSGGI